MLKSISATNYRSFRRLSVELAPLTLFVGPNNSGKSSIVSVIRLLSQTIESNDPNVRLLLNGALGDFGTYKDLVHENETRRHLDISFTIIPETDLRLIRANKRSIAFNLQYKYRSSLKEIILKRIECHGDGEHHITAEFSEDSERFLVRRVADQDVPPSFASSGTFHTFDVRNFLPRFALSPPTENLDALAKLAIDKARLVSRNAFITAHAFQSPEWSCLLMRP